MHEIKPTVGATNKEMKQVGTGNKEQKELNKWA
jgi:hypothetical protein